MIESKHDGTPLKPPGLLQQRRIVIRLVIVAIGVIGVLVMVLVLRNSQLTRADKVIQAFHASFPEFCPNGQILVNDTITSSAAGQVPGPGPAGRYWGIRCDTWMKVVAAFYGYAAIVDVDACSVTFQAGATLGRYFDELQALSRHNGLMPV